MEQCDGCKEWYHGRCVNITPQETEQMDTYTCPHCQLSPGLQVSGTLLHPPSFVFQIKVNTAEEFSVTEEYEMEEVMEFIDLQVSESPGKGAQKRRKNRRVKERRRRVRRAEE